ncbi:MAG: hypothetical protein KDD78_18095, partial [Caldilineaceae bacterium]|nr:hypothetical protein [Caldilineaceae bacterium]
AAAAVLDPFTSDTFNGYVWGDYILTGNSVMRCISAADQDVRDVDGDGNTTEQLGPILEWAYYADCLADSNNATTSTKPNDQRWMVYNETDTTTAAVFNSSDATFTIPPGATIAHAELYWSGNTAEAINSPALRSAFTGVLDNEPYSGGPTNTGTAADPWYSCNASYTAIDQNSYGGSLAYFSSTSRVPARRQVAAQPLDGVIDAMSFRVTSANGSTGYQDVSADEFYVGEQNNSGEYYAAQMDITNILNAQLATLGTGTPWTVTGANIYTGQGFNCHGGWAIAVVYEYPVRDAVNAPDYRHIEIFDGMAEVVSSSSSTNPDEVNLTLESFIASSGSVEPRLGIVAYEGDQGIANDQLTLEAGEADELTLTEPKLGITTNFYASTIGDFTSTGSSVTRSPSYVNTDGIDIKVVPVDENIIINNASDLDVKIYTLGDRFVSQVFTLSAVDSAISGEVYEDLNNNGVRDEGEPGIEGVTVTLTGTDADNNPVSTTVLTNEAGGYVFENVPASDAT